MVRTNLQTSSAGAATEKKPLPWKLANFIIAYRTRPHATTGKTAAMLHGRNIRTRLDALKPNIRERVEDKQQDLELSLINSHTRKLHISEEVIARDYCGGKKERPGVKTALRGPSTYEVRVAPNTVWRRHIDQLKGSALHLRSDQGGGQPQTSSAVFTAIPQTTRSIGREVPQSHTTGNIESSSPEKHISPPLSYLGRPGDCCPLAAQGHLLGVICYQIILMTLD